MPAEDDFYRPRRSRALGGRLLVGLVLLLMLAGLGALAWTLGGLKGSFSFGSHDPATGEGPPLVDAPPTVPPGDPNALAAPATPEALGTRMSDLEQRVIRASVAAQSASAYANRAEAIMVAFAARRALDAGQPLDYLEGQLRLLFGEAQPKAVATIINAAADPVTGNKLMAGLEDIDSLVGQSSAREGWFSSTMRTLGSIVELRSAGAPSPEPAQRLARARRAVVAGQIEDAIKEMAAMPSQPAVAQWLEQARRYNEAHRALDVIEQAAILEPRTTPMIAAPAAAGQAPAADAAAPAPAPTPEPAKN